MTVHSKMLNAKLTLYRIYRNKVFTPNISDCSLLDPVAQTLTLQFLLNNIMWTWCIFCLSVWLPWGRVLDYEIMCWNMQGIKKHLRDPLLQDLGGVFVIKSQALLCYFDQSFLDISKLIMAQMLQYLVGFSNYSLGILLCNNLLQQLLATGNSNASIFG